MQAALEGAESAANSRSTSHAPSRAHSPDLFAGRQDHADPYGSRAHSPAGSEVPNSEPDSEAEHSSNSPEQARSREAHWPDSRASAVHSSLKRPPDSGQHKLQHDADAISEQMPDDTHSIDPSGDLSGSQPSSIQKHIAASKEELMATGTVAPANGSLPVAQPGIAVIDSSAASLAASAESPSSSVRQSPEWQSSSLAHASVSSLLASNHSSSPDRNMLSRNSLDSTGPLHANQQENDADITSSAAQSLDGLLLMAAHCTSSELLPQDSSQIHATVKGGAQPLECLPSVTVVQPAERRRHTPDINHTAAQREVLQVRQHMILGEPEAYAQASFPDLPAQSDAEYNSASGDLSSGSMAADADAHTVASSCHMLDSAINDDAVTLTADADGGMSLSQSSSTGLGKAPAEEPLPVASQKTRIQSGKAVVALTAAPALPPVPVAAAMTAQLDSKDMPEAQSASSQPHQDARLSEAESVSPAASDLGSVLGDSRSHQARTHVSDDESSSCAASSNHAAVLEVGKAGLLSMKASPEYKVMSFLPGQPGMILGFSLN